VLAHSLWVLLLLLLGVPRAAGGLTDAAAPVPSWRRCPGPFLMALCSRCPSLLLSCERRLVCGLLEQVTYLLIGCLRKVLGSPSH